MLSIGGTYRHVTERAPTAKLGGDRWILNFSGRSCAWKARYIDLDQHMAFFVPLDRGIYDRVGSAFRLLPALADRALRKWTDGSAFPGRPAEKFNVERFKRRDDLDNSLFWSTTHMD